MVCCSHEGDGRASTRRHTGNPCKRTSPSTRSRIRRRRVLSCCAWVLAAHTRQRLTSGKLTWLASTYVARPTLRSAAVAHGVSMHRRKRRRRSAFTCSRVATCPPQMTAGRWIRTVSSRCAANRRRRASRRKRCTRGGTRRCPSTWRSRLFDSRRRYGLCGCTPSIVGVR